jgi:indole-3-glycerol phosphate synthase
MSGTLETPAADLLGTIIAATRRITQVRMDREPLPALTRRAEQRSPRPGLFTAALSRRDRWNVIAECKRRSPSRGVLRKEYDPVAIAGSYAAAGAAAISVLTEPTFFDGALDHLAQVREQVSTPLLRKDFIVSEYQLFEARAAGADAALLIVAALTPATLKSLAATAASLGLDTLIEVHDAEELAVAVDCGARVIGVNNRNLRTLAVDVHASDALVSMMPKGVVAVSESGLKSAADLSRLSALGYGAFLIGERFMIEPDPGAALAALLGGA